MPIENTTNRDPLLHLAGVMSDGSSGYIGDMEAAGQAQVVNSDVLPAEIIRADRAVFEALGFRFGKPVEGDPLFVHATLPDGWSRVGTDHNMWSDIVDERGIARVGIFYKAAFYDRRAHMMLTNVGGGFVSRHMHGGDPIPWDLLTDLELVQVLEAASYEVNQSEQYPDIYTDGDKARALLAEVASRSGE